jgi:hypothetical protein
MVVVGSDDGDDDGGIVDTTGTAVEGAKVGALVGTTTIGMTLVKLGRDRTMNTLFQFSSFSGLA